MYNEYISAYESGEIIKNFARFRPSGGIFEGLNLSRRSDYLIFTERIKKSFNINPITQLELKQKILNALGLTHVSDINDEAVKYLLTSESCRNKLFTCTDMSYQNGIYICIYKNGSYRVCHNGYSPAKYFNLENWLDVLEEIHVRINQSNWYDKKEEDSDLGLI